MLIAEIITNARNVEMESLIQDSKLSYYYNSSNLFLMVLESGTSF